MPEVTCPSCSTRQPIEAGSVEYSCAECGIDWRLVACGRCGKRFHARAGSTAWTCPSCGLEQEIISAERGRHPEYMRAPASGRPARLAMLAAGIVIVVLGSFLLTRGGGEASPTGDASGGDILATACAHKLGIGEIRYDAFLRNAATFRKDSAALEQDGQTDAAAKFADLADSLEAYAIVLEASADTTEVEASMQEALLALPC